MVFTREKNDTSNQNRERCFFTCEKNDTSNQKPQRCVSFAPKFPPFIAACSAASHTFINEKSFTQGVFLAKKVKNISEMEWNSFVCFTVDKYDVSRYPAAGNCFQKTRYPAVRNFDQFFRNGSFNSSKNIRYLFRNVKRL